MIESLGMKVTADELAAMIKKADADGSGEIELNEFIEVVVAEEKKAKDAPPGSKDAFGLASIISRKANSGPPMNWRAGASASSSRARKRLRACGCTCAPCACAPARLRLAARVLMRPVLVRPVPVADERRACALRVCVCVARAVHSFRGLDQGIQG